MYLVPILAQHDVLHAVAEGEILSAADGMASTAGLCHCKTVVPSAHIPYLTLHQIKRLLFGAIRDHALRHISPHHAVEQRLEIIHMLVDHAVTMQFFKQLLRTRYFCLLNRTKLERGERSLRLRDET